MIRPLDTVRAAALVAIAVLLAVLAATSDTSAATIVVKVGRNAANQFADAYVPSSLTISAGDTVRWEWDGERPHDVTSYTTGLFASPGGKGGMTSPAAVYSVTFATPGTYTYYCQERANRADADPSVVDASIAAGRMVGKIVVVSASDITAPTASDVGATPNPTGAATSVTLTATITDTGTPSTAISAAEYFLDTAGAAGTGIAMQAADGSFNATSESVTATVNLASVVPGNHQIFVRGRDSAGNWSTAASMTLTVSSSDPPAVVQVGQDSSGAPNRAFNPPAVTIAPGGTVRWQWFNGSHDVQAQDGSYSSGARGGMNSAGAVFERVFGAAGTFTYYCSNHAGVGDADPSRIDEAIAAGKMVGKIVVAVGPATSNLAATPNPTGGAATTTITATIADSSNPLSPIAAAEYFLDTTGANGTGTPMLAADGAFSSAIEQVTAILDTSGLAPGSHTIRVHGRNAAGSWGALAAITLTVDGGGLRMTPQPVAFPSVGAGTEQVIMAAPTTWRAEDTTGSGAGWRITVTSTDFASAGGSIPVANFRMRLLATAITRVSGTGQVPVSQVTTFTSLSATVPLVILRAAAGTGQGTFDFVPDFQLTIPASVAEGAYSASMVVTIASGP